MPHAPDLSGRALNDRYELHELIGEGAFGRVYRGTDRRLARPVAVKVIKPWWSEDPEWMDSFDREAQLLARVNDPGIVQIFDVGRAPEGFYYVEELLEGGSLAERVRGGALPALEACELAVQLCSALAQAHAHGVVHRDVKPANVLISADGRVKVGDFGVALLAEASSEGAGATVVGTPRYMAPEQAQGRHPTPATDIYSVGVVLYEMLSGHPPFSGGTAVELALKHLHDRPPALPASVPAALERIVLRALAKNPADRYTSASAMAEALSRFVRTEIEQRALRSRARGSVRVPAGEVAARPGSGRRSRAHEAGRGIREGTPNRAEGSVATLVRPDDRPHVQRGRRPGSVDMDVRARVDRTQVAPVRNPRRDMNPSARRRTAALLALVVTTLVGMAVGAVVLAKPHRKTPPPVKLPRLAGETSANARVVLRSIGLRVRVTAVPAPGIAAGVVTRQAPAAATALPPGSTVRLFVAEVPRWRVVTSFSGENTGHSVPFRIRGTKWRIVYGMGYDGSCTFVVFCSGPSAKVSNLRDSSSDSPFDLNDGQNQIQTFSSGAGIYQVTISSGDDNARWTMKVEDWY